MIAILWIVVGVASAMVIVLATGIIPFIVPGFVVGICGAIFHTLIAHLAIRVPWWLSAVIITVLSVSLTMLLVPDTRYWVITRLILAYYSILTFSFCLIKSLVDKK